MGCLVQTYMNQNLAILGLFLFKILGLKIYIEMIY